MGGGRLGSAAALLAVLILLLSSCTTVQPSTARPAGVRGDVGAGLLQLAPSAARTTSFTGDGVVIRGYHVIVVELDITAVSGTTPTLDVKVQTLVDGTNWCDVAAFSQANAATRQLLRISAITTPQAQVACTDATLAAGTIHQGPLGSQLRIKHAAPGGTATPTFTYSVSAWAGE